MTTPVRQIETVLIPAGAFTMGDDAGRPDERPAHRVTLSAFRIAVLPVTNEEYAAFLAATAGEPPRFWDDPAFNHTRQPVVGVSWHEAAGYCDWASLVHDAPVRLPTEAEWEKAARGGLDGATYPWGDELVRRLRRALPAGCDVAGWRRAAQRLRHHRHRLQHPRVVLGLV